MRDSAYVEGECHLQRGSPDEGLGLHLCALSPGSGGTTPAGTPTKERKETVDLLLRCRILP